MTHEPNFDELIGAEATGEERERLRHTHELLLQAGPPPELPPSLQKVPTFGKTGVIRLERKRVVKRRALVLLAAALSVVAVFFAGWAAHGGGGSVTSTKPDISLNLLGTSAQPNASGTLAVWRERSGNWPMTLSVVGLPRLTHHRYYEVYLVRHGHPWGLCGTFRGTNSSDPLIVTLNAPYRLQKGDSWVVTRPTQSGGEPGQTVLTPALKI